MSGYQPMLAVLAPAPFDADNYIFEPKWDGVRCLAYVSQDEVKLVARSGRDITDRFPEISRPAFAASSSMVLDGELVCGDSPATLGTTGSFRLIQSRIHTQDAFAIKLASRHNPATYQVFDNLEVNDTPIVAHALWARMESLTKHLKESDRVRHTLMVERTGIAMFEDLAAMGFEGIMAKALNSPYLPGQRSPYWKKVKRGAEDVLFAVGLTAGQGARRGTFGALVLASKEGVLCGEVGTGFKNHDLEEILSIVDDAPQLAANMTLTGVRWIKPIRCKVRYLDKTAGGKLRFPSFKGLER